MSLMPLVQGSGFWYAGRLAVTGLGIYILLPTLVASGSQAWAGTPPFCFLPSASQGASSYFVSTVL